MLSSKKVGWREAGTEGKVSGARGCRSRGRVLDALVAKSWARRRLCSSRWPCAACSYWLPGSSSTAGQEPICKISEPLPGFVLTGAGGELVYCLKIWAKNVIFTKEQLSTGSLPPRKTGSATQAPRVWAKKKQMKGCNKFSRPSNSAGQNLLPVNIFHLTDSRNTK